MEWRKTIKTIFVAFGAFIGLLAFVTAAILFLGVTIRLDFLRPAVEKGAADALGRPVAIEGSIELTPGLRPVISVSRVRIDNAANLPEKQFVFIELARTQIDIPDLLAREVSIGEITAEGIALHLISDAKGQNNWTIAHDGESQELKKKDIERDTASTSTEAPPEERRIRFTSLDRLSLTNIAVNRC